MATNHAIVERAIVRTYDGIICYHSDIAAKCTNRITLLQALPWIHKRVGRWFSKQSWRVLGWVEHSLETSNCVLFTTHTHTHTHTLIHTHTHTHTHIFMQFFSPTMAILYTHHDAEYVLGTFQKLWCGNEVKPKALMWVSGAELKAFDVDTTPYPLSKHSLVVATQVMHSVQSKVKYRQNFIKSLVCIHCRNGFNVCVPAFLYSMQYTHAYNTIHNYVYAQTDQEWI